MDIEQKEATHYRTCNLCEAMCGIEITMKDAKIHSIRGDKDDPFSQGYICPKAVALQDLYYDEDRVRYPLRRTTSGWQRISWEEAFDEVANKLKHIQTKYGKNAVGIYTGNPTAHNYGSMLFGPFFFNSLNSQNRFSANSVDQLAHHFSSYLLYGHQFLFPVPDLKRTDFLLMLGANPAASNGSMMSVSNAAGHLKQIRKRGGKVILIDPRRTETLQLVDSHHFIRPGTDVFLLLALLQVIFAEKLTRPGRLVDFTDGFEQIGKLVAEFSPERVAPITGIAATEIRTLAREFALAKTAVCYGRMGVSTQEFGAVCQWLINVLNIVTGNLDRPGGALFTLPAFDPITAPEILAPKGSIGKWHSRVRKLPEFSGELPVVALAEEILTPGDGQIRALVTSAGNPVLSTPNGQQLDQALASLDFMVSIDFFINETTRHAHIILPPTASLEHDNYDLAFHLLAIHNTTKYSPALFTPRNDSSRHDWEIFLELHTRMESKDVFSRFTSAIKHTIMQKLGPAGMLDLGLRFGPYGAKLNPFAQKLTLSKLKESPHGLELGALETCLPARLQTPTKRINLAPDILVKDLVRVKERLIANTPDDQKSQLLLIGRRHLRSNNSWLHNSLRLVKGRSLCTLMMNPLDANQRQIANGQKVAVSSRTGRIEIAVEITEEIMAGVVSMPHGWGHDRPNVALEVAREHAGVSINDLTDELAIDSLIGTAAFSGILVKVEALANYANTQTDVVFCNTNN